MLYSKTNSKFQKKKGLVLGKFIKPTPPHYFWNCGIIKQRRLSKLERRINVKGIYQQDSIHQDKTEHVLETREANHMVTIRGKIQVLLQCPKHNWNIIMATATIYIC